jgi:hypothetical protein
MSSENKNVLDLNGLIKDLEIFIELSFQEQNTPLKNWLNKAMIINHFQSRCYITNDCEEKNCPAYKNERGRCWLIAGTMCGGRPQGKFIKKYGFCTKCEFFQNVIGNDPVHKLQELIIILVHSLEIKRDELKDALSSIKTLRGLLPICATCKKIRDDRGYWKRIESYIKDHSEAEFTHGICPDCFQKQIDAFENEQ